MVKVEFVAEYNGNIVDRQWLWFDHKSEIPKAFEDWEREVLSEIESRWIILKEEDK